MKLSRIYSNRPEAFPRIDFRPGLNVILAEIREPENLERDTHNLGKTTLAALIDFCLLKKKNRSFFLFKHEELFEEFVFFLEIELHSGTFVTIRRSVAKQSKISFSYSPQTQVDLTELQEEDWTHWLLPFERSKDLLDGLLDFQCISAWPYRKPLGYALRLQDDYRDVFQLDKFRGAHSQWKPFLAEMIGLDGELVRESYELLGDATQIANEVEHLESQLSLFADSPDRLEGMILLRNREVESLSNRLHSFDFKIPDAQATQELVNEIESQIAALNQRRYHLRMSRTSIQKTLNETIKFDLQSIEKVFGEAKVYFGDQLKRDYGDLIEFLTSLSDERAAYLSEDLKEIEKELEEVDGELQGLNARRKSALRALREAETFAKYRQLTEKLVDLKITLGMLERQRDQMTRLTRLRRELSNLRQQRLAVVESIEENLSRAAIEAGTYQQIRLDFSDFVNAVLDRSAVLSSSLNNEGNLEFSADVLDESGTATSADLGHTYRKLLCIAFDVAVFSAYLDRSFVHFVYHDGVFESLDDRKKLCLIQEIRQACESGLQQIITVIDSDLPYDSSGQRLSFEDDEIVRRLHDQGNEGRLFRIDSW